MSESPSQTPAYPVRWSIYLVLIGTAAAIGTVFLMNVLRKPPSITDVSVISSVAGTKEHVRLPYTIMAEPEEKLEFTITLTYNPDEATVFYVVPDDCVEIFNVNRERVKLSAAANEQRCNWQSGFSVDLKPYLQEGENKIFLQVRNKSGKAGLRFSTDSDMP